LAGALPPPPVLIQELYLRLDAPLRLSPRWHHGRGSIGRVVNGLPPRAQCPASSPHV